MENAKVSLHDIVLHCCFFFSFYKSSYTRFCCIHYYPSAIHIIRIHRKGREAQRENCKLAYKGRDKGFSPLCTYAIRLHQCMQLYQKTHCFLLQTVINFQHADISSTTEFENLDQISTSMQSSRMNECADPKIRAAGQKTRKNCDSLSVKMLIETG